jgi:hypothetical protein
MNETPTTEKLITDALDALLEIKAKHPIDWSNANLLLREGCDNGSLADAVAILQYALTLGHVDE